MDFNDNVLENQLFVIVMQTKPKQVLSQYCFFFCEENKIHLHFVCHEHMKHVNKIENL